MMKAARPACVPSGALQEHGWTELKEVTRGCGAQRQRVSPDERFQGATVNQKFGQTVLMITHNPEAAEIGDPHARCHIVAPDQDPQWARHP